MITSFADSSVASRYQTLITARGISFTFVESGKLKLPAAAGSELRYATACAGPMMTPAPHRKVLR